MNFENFERRSAWLLACIAEDEALAQAAHYEGQRWLAEEEAVVAADRDLDPIMYLDRKRDAQHAANWPPARVLAQCEAHRRIVEGMQLFGPIDDINANEVLGLIATIYADRPGYEEWVS